MAKSYRQGRIGEEIRRIISEMLLSEIKDPRLSGLVSITGVDVTRDVSYATCYITILGTGNGGMPTDEEKEEVLAGFNSVKGMIKREIGHKIRLHHVPELIFKIDESIEYGRHIDELIEKLNKGDR